MCFGQLSKAIWKNALTKREKKKKESEKKKAYGDNKKSDFSYELILKNKFIMRIKTKALTSRTLCELNDTRFVLRIKMPFLSPKHT